MKKVIVAVILLIVLAVIWYLGSPLFIDKKVSEEFPASLQATSTYQVVSKGQFTGFDKIHNGSGTVSLIKTEQGYIVRFEDDFQVNNGPDLHVGFGRDGKYISGSEISPLKGNIGSQNYEIPGTRSVDDFNEVWIWCKQFSVAFAKAHLN